MSVATAFNVQYHNAKIFQDLSAAIRNFEQSLVQNICASHRHIRTN